MLAKILQAFVLFMLILCVATLVGCEGETGPAGLAGSNGQDGSDGQDGQDGNANVIMFDFGSKTTTTGVLDYYFNASRALVDSSLVIAFAKTSISVESMWYPVPGLGSGNNYMIRSFWYESSSGVYLYAVKLLTPDGASVYTTSVTFSEFRVFLIPASSIVPGNKSGELDLTDYSSVQKYFNLPD